MFYGNIVYDSGAIASDRSHGHSFFHENSTGTDKSSGFNSFDIGMQAYGVTGPFAGGEIRGNIFFNSGAPGSSNGSRNINLLVGTDKEPDSRSGDRG